MDRAAAFTTILAFLEGFRHCFTRRAFPYFVEFVEALWLEGSRRTVTRIWEFADARRHFSCYHRFLTTYRWNVGTVACRSGSGTAALAPVAVEVRLGAARGRKDCPSGGRGLRDRVGPPVSVLFRGLAVSGGGGVGGDVGGGGCSEGWEGTKGTEGTSGTKDGSDGVGVVCEGGERAVSVLLRARW
jgi:hypothetical protein